MKKYEIKIILLFFIRRFLSQAAFTAKNCFAATRFPVFIYTTLATSVFLWELNRKCIPPKLWDLLWCLTHLPQ